MTVTEAGRAASRAARRASAEEARLVPRAGERRPAALRSWLPLRLPTHQASSATLAGAYPFLAAASLGSEGVYVGVDALSGASFCFDPWVLYTRGQLTNPNVLLAGVIGQGKSALAKSLAVRSIAYGRQVYVPADPKGEWAPVARAVGGTVITLGPGLATRMNPLDPGPRPSGQNEAAWGAATATRRRQLLASLAEATLRRPLRPVEHTALDVAVRAIAGGEVARGAPITLPMVVAALLAPDATIGEGEHGVARVLADDGRNVAHALRRLVHGDLAGLFDGPSTQVLDPQAPMVVLDLSRVAADDESLGLVMTCASSWLEAALADLAGGQRWVVYDEAWRLLRQLPLIRRMQGQWKLSRAYGIANLLVIHRLSDLDAVGGAGSEARAIAEGLLADCSTRIVYRQESDQLRGTALTLGLTDVERELLPDLPRGSGLWKVSGRSYVVHHRLHEEEASVYDTDAAMTRTREGGVDRGVRFPA